MELTDFEKFKEIFEDNEYEYEVVETGLSFTTKSIRVVNNITSWVDIMFTENGEFVEFEPWIE